MQWNPRRSIRARLILAFLALGLVPLMLVSLVAFWLVDVRGVLNLYVLTSNVLCGLLVPVHFLPGWAQAVAYATPFPSMLQTPVDIVTERSTGAGALGLLAVQAGWAVALLAVAVWVFDRGTRRLVVQGG